MTGALTSPDPGRTAGQIAHLAAAIRQRAVLQRRRLGVALALAVAAAAIRGTPGVIAALIALMLLVDAALPIHGGTWPEADDRFRRLLARRRRAERMLRLRGRAPERLDVIEERSGELATAERRDLGIQLVPVGAITGTVEGLKAHAFDREFRPDRAAGQRWKHLWIAQAHGTALPPISVYRIGEAYVVRDGHHRVSVARDHGAAQIEAEVTELRVRRPAYR